MIQLRYIFQQIANGITTGDLHGCWWAAYLILGIYFCTMLKENICDIHDKNQILNYAGLVSFYVVFFCAASLMYENSPRHFAVLVVLGIFFAALDITSVSEQKLKCVAGIFFFLFLFNTSHDSDWIIPSKDEESVATISEGAELLNENLQLDLSSENEWDNTIIWLLRDDGGVTKWQDLYATPSGMGISCCRIDYIKDNFDQLKSKYMLTSITGEINDLCRESGAELIAEYDEVYVWKLRD